MQIIQGRNKDVQAFIEWMQWVKEISSMSMGISHDPGTFPAGTWVRVKNGEGIRYVTMQTSTETFLDDGKCSLQPYSRHCYYKYYEPITNYSIVKYQPHESNSTTG
jgi:hypothetical protein